MPEPMERPVPAAGSDLTRSVAGRPTTGRHHPVELELEGSTTAAGAFRGRGSLTLFVSDAARAKIGLDYRGSDRILLTVQSEGGIRLSADDSLKLSGGLTRDLVNGEIGGEVTARIRLSRDLDAEIEQTFGSSGPTTSVSVRLRL